MSDTATQEKAGKKDNRSNPAPRAVEYDIEVFEGEPPPAQVGGARSPLEDKLEEVRKRTDLVGKWVSIGTYEKSTACGAAANVMRQRHGRTPAVEGWEFRATRTPGEDNKDRMKLLVRHTPDQIVEGAKEQHEKAEKERVRKLEEAKQAKANEQMAKGEKKESHPESQPQPPQQSSPQPQPSTAKARETVGQPDARPNEGGKVAAQPQNHRQQSASNA